MFILKRKGAAIFEQIKKVIPARTKFNFGVVVEPTILERPKEMTKIFCGTVGIPFIEEALTWKVGSNLSQYSWWDGGSFHSSLSKSTGLKSQQRNYVKIQNTPIRVQSVYRRMMPHYQHLYKFRLH